MITVPRTVIPSVLCLIVLLWLVISSSRVPKKRLLKIFLAYVTTIVLFTNIYYEIYLTGIEQLVSNVEAELEAAARRGQISEESFAESISRLIDDLPFSFTEEYDTFRRQVPDMASLLISNLKSLGPVSEEDRSDRYIEVTRPLLDRIRGSNSGASAYFDLLYFSTITITTIGYGDILPNDTVVRGVVILEILIGITLLVFFINSTSSVWEKAREARRRSGDPEEK